MQKLILFLSIWMVVICQPASAEQICQADNNQYIIDLKKIIVPPNSQPGDVLGVVSNTLNITCKAGKRHQEILRVTNPSWNRSGMTANVDGLTCAVLDTDTGISDLGLGIVWTNFNSGAGKWGCMSVYFPDMNSVGTRRGLRSNGTVAITDKFYLVKTGKSSDYGKIGHIEQTIFMAEADDDNNLLGDLYRIDFKGDVQLSKAGCAVETHKDVQMGTVSSATFHGKGSKGPAVPFAITLSDCQGIAANVMMRLEPGYGYADKNEGVIALSNEEGAAAGVGIQLMLDGQKIDTTRDAISYPFQAGTTTIPFSARYYQTADRIQPGTADSTMVFYIFYE
ncbi:fimbrial protein [Erwinia sp. 198]|uniref:fimbrial protein n=1 Tax=Erwinia sp. 198 TaxID=2022746 RepID=UPI000F6783CD|nr:fimbrial protein [Erwinia sp. 198]RRZ96980.1 type 1 fimbrial protein [Erwinia sp. 198]